MGLLHCAECNEEIVLGDITYNIYDNLFCSSACLVSYYDCIFTLTKDEFFNFVEQEELFEYLFGTAELCEYCLLENKESITPDGVVYCEGIKSYCDKAFEKYLDYME
jgi:hypothetical protein